MQFPGRSHGFTLIEVLVVVVIVGIISAVVILSFGIVGDDRNLQREARRLTSLIELAADEALMQGREFGLEFTRTGYRFLEYDPLTNRWYELVGDDLLRPRTLAESLELELELEEREINLGERFASTEEDEKDDEDDRALGDDYAPHVLIFSSGDITPFDLTVLRPADRSEIFVDMAPDGRMEIRTAREGST